METLGKILMGAVVGAGIYHVVLMKQEEKRQNPSDLEVLGLEERISRLSDASERSTPSYLQAPMHQPVMMPPAMSYGSPYVTRGIF